MLYFSIIIYLILSALIYDFIEIKTGKNLNFYLIYILFICLSGFRYYVGGDTFNYIYQHNFIPTLSELPHANIGVTKFRPLWLLLSSSAKSITDSFILVQFIHAIIVNSIIFKFIKDNTKNIFTAILLYFIGYYFYFNFEILRESLAICVFIISLKYYSKNKWFYYYIFAFVAFLFHYSAIILFVIPLFKNVEIKYGYILIFFIAGAFLNKMLLNYLDSLSGNTIVSYYIETYKTYNYTFYGLISIALFYIIYPKLLLIINDNFLKINYKFFKLFNLYMILGAASALFFIFFRFLNYFTPILFLLLADMLHALYIKGIFIRKMRVAIIAFLLIAFIHCNKYFADTSKYAAGSRWYSHWYPYYSIFNKKIDPIREKFVYEERSND